MKDDFNEIDELLDSIASMGPRSDTSHVNTNGIPSAIPVTIPIGLSTPTVDSAAKRKFHINDHLRIDVEACGIHNMVIDALSAVQLRVVKSSARIINNDTEIEFMCIHNYHVWSCIAHRLFGNPIVIHGCPLCGVDAKLEFSKQGILPEKCVRDIDERAVVYGCKLHHRFLVNDIYSSAKSRRCPVHDLEVRARNTRNINILFGDTVYTGPDTYIRFTCQDCRGTSYTNSRPIYGKDNFGIADCKRCHAPTRNQEVLRIKRIFELYFGVKFDDFDAPLFRAPYPLGYNAGLHIAYFHEKISPVTAADIQRLSDLGVKCFVISAKFIKSHEIIRAVATRMLELDMDVGVGSNPEDKIHRFVTRVRAMQRLDNNDGVMFHV